MPSDHGPRPDGSNGLFYKELLVIVEDFYRYVQFSMCAILTWSASINFFISLSPKKGNPMTLKYFRPISLLNYSLKLLTKLVANRLQSFILKVVYAN
jgi:hypothetical protein